MDNFSVVFERGTKVLKHRGNVIARGEEAVKTFIQKTSNFTVQKFDDYIARIRTRNPAGNSNDPRRLYQESVAGSREFEIKGEIVLRFGLMVWRDRKESY